MKAAARETGKPVDAKLAELVKALARQAAREDHALEQARCATGAGQGAMVGKGAVARKT